VLLLLLLFLLGVSLVCTSVDTPSTSFGKELMTVYTSSSFLHTCTWTPVLSNKKQNVPFLFVPHQRAVLNARF
jgi:hypothetical protein